MQKYSQHSVKGEQTEQPERVRKVEAPKIRRLVLSIDARYKITGKYSGQEYIFNGAGSENDVNEIDVEWMLSLRQGTRQCCGGDANGNIVFRLKE